LDLHYYKTQICLAAISIQKDSCLCSIGGQFLSFPVFSLTLTITSPHVVLSGLVGLHGARNSLKPKFNPYLSLVSIPSFFLHVTLQKIAQPFAHHICAHTTPFLHGPTQIKYLSAGCINK
jgi:hypothetical protein